MIKAKTAIIPFERIATAIHLIRGQKVMLDRDLALLYGVETRVLNQAVRRNYNRFPPDFMLTLAREEIRQMTSERPPAIDFHVETDSGAAGP